MNCWWICLGNPPANEPLRDKVLVHGMLSMTEGASIASDALHYVQRTYGLLDYCKSSFQFCHASNRDQDCRQLFVLSIEVFLPQDA
jgi:hypothetical protein